MAQVLSDLVVEYETVPGWKQSLAQCRNFEDLPPGAQVRMAMARQWLGRACCMLPWSWSGARGVRKRACALLTTSDERGGPGLARPDPIWPT